MCGEVGDRSIFVSRLSLGRMAPADFRSVASLVLLRASAYADPNPTKMDAYRRKEVVWLSDTCSLRSFTVN